MTNGRRALGSAAVVVGLLVGALLLLLPTRPQPAPDPVAEIVVGGSAGPLGPGDPASRSAVPEVVPPPAPITDDDDDDDDDDLGDDDLGDDGLRDDDD